MQRRSASVRRKGNCYRAAFDALLDGRTPPGSVLVHGEATGQGPIEDVRFGHAWVEHGDLVYEFSNGLDLVLSAHLYYAVGQIVEEVYGQRKLFRYTVNEARNWALETGHYGPWELETEH